MANKTKTVWYGVMLVIIFEQIFLSCSELIHSDEVTIVFKLSF